MINKKYILILLIVIAGICAISAASAADNAADGVAIDDANDIAVNIDKDLENADESAEGESKLASSEDDSELGTDESSETLSLSGDSYKIDLNDEYQISSYEDGKIKYYREDCKDLSQDAYHYFIRVYDNKQKPVYEKTIINKSGHVRANGNANHTIKANSLAPGTYVLKFINYDDATIMDSAVLKVSGNAKIKASDYTVYYKSDSKKTATLTDEKTGKPMGAVTVQVALTKGKTIIKHNFKTDSNGKIYFKIPVTTGTWVVKFTPVESYVSGTINKVVTVKKATVTVKAKKANGYTGYKVKLKATVTTHGKKVTEGKVVFNINGKKYYANVKNGKATYEVSLNKAQKYTYSAKFLGSANLYKSAKSKSKAKVRQTFSTKIYPKAYKIKATKKLFFNVKTTDGKKVSSGQLKVKMKKAFWIKVSNGKATFKLKKYMKNAYYKKKGKLKVNYIPDTNQYKSTYKKYKLKR